MSGMDCVEKSELDGRLERLLGSIDVASDFDARVLQRVRAEDAAETLAPAARGEALSRAQRHYQVAMKHLKLTRRRMFQALTLDSLAAAAVLSLVASFISGDTFISKLLQMPAQHSLLVGTLAGIVVVFIPLAVLMLAERRTHDSA